jgi:hypothetical protein
MSHPENNVQSIHESRASDWPGAYQEMLDELLENGARTWEADPWLSVADADAGDEIELRLVSL